MELCREDMSVKTVQIHVPNHTILLRELALHVDDSHSIEFNLPIISCQRSCKRLLKSMAFNFAEVIGRGICSSTIGKQARRRM